ncbi:MATE family efflux transporter, partial [Streptococcus suis]
GIVSALVPIIAQYLGKGERDKILEEFHQFVYLALGLTILLLCSVLFIAVPALAQFGLEESIFQVGRQSLSFISIGILPLL